MATKNKIDILGYLGKDPDLREIGKNATQVCSFSIATTKKKGETETTTWFRVQVFGRQAESCYNYLKKGAQVWVSGELVQSEWNDKDGNARTTLEVSATDVTFVNLKTDDAAPQQSSSNKQNRAASAGRSAITEEPYVADDDDVGF
jgi:single-strand DNA-binding protein